MRLQVGAGGLKALAAAKAPMTMDEILEARHHAAHTAFIACCRTCSGAVVCCLCRHVVAAVFCIEHFQYGTYACPDA